MKYKVGDKVRIKSLDWYNQNKDEDDNVPLIDSTNSYYNFIEMMRGLCGKVMTISSVNSNYYDMVEDAGKYFWTDEMIEGLAERNGKIYPYNIGDRVILKGKNRCATITDLKYDSFGNLSYYIKIDNDKDISIDCPTELLLPYDNKKTETHRGYSTTDVETTNESKKMARFTFDDNDFANKVELDLSNCELIQEDGKWFVVKKKNEYPKTYEECCKVLGIPIHGGIALVGNWCMEDGYIVQHLETLRALSKLLICRDAYWKIAGEEMGLGKSWKPDWTDQESPKYCITSIKDQVEASKRYYIMNTILAFPTEEMRGTFYENFKELIENCKELL